MKRSQPESSQVVPCLKRIKSSPLWPSPEKDKMPSKWFVGCKVREGARAPAKANPEDAGFDVFACFPPAAALAAMQKDLRTTVSETKAGICLHMAPGARARIPIGWRTSFNPKSALLVWPRSGMANGQGVDTLAGCIDSNYRGEISVILVNHGANQVDIPDGHKVAQLLHVPLVPTSFKEVESLTATTRGAGGFGSTGHV